MLKKLGLLLSVFLVLIAFSSWKNTGHSQVSRTEKQWVDSVYHSLSQRERIGQLFMVAAYSNKDEAHVRSVEKLIQEYKIGGLIFFQGGPGRQVNLLNRFQKAANVPLLIGFDGEWGLGMRLDSTYSYPRQMTLGAIQNDQLIYDMGVQIAEQCQRVGVHVNFAPVVDINVNPKNPVIGTRSFGENKNKVAIKGSLYMQGMQDNKVIACAKHFPGHGDTDKDSHKALPIINHTKERIEEIELYPFRKLINDSLGSVMVAHLSVPSLDDRPNRATTLSYKVVTGMLKEDLQFKGLVFTDALNMKGVSNYFKPGEADLEAFLAGNDVLLFPKNVPDAVNRIEKALKEGQITEKSFAARVKKILSAKYWSGAAHFKPLPVKNINKDVMHEKYEALIQKLYEASVTVIRNKSNLIPIQVIDTNRFASLTIGKRTSTTFRRKLGKYASFKHFHWDGENQAQYQSILKQLKSYSIVVVGLTGMNNSASRRFGISSTANKFLFDLEKQSRVITVAFGNPYGLKYLDTHENVICTYQKNKYTLDIAPQVIFGALGASGKLPVTASVNVKEGAGVTVKKLNRLGYSAPERSGLDSETLNIIDTIANYAIEGGATPGCQVLVAKDGKVVFEKSYGHYTYEKKKPVSDSTLYDIASVTKVAATAQAFMMLYDQGIFDLDAPASTYLPELMRTNKQNIYLRELLVHQGGLFPFLNHWKRTLAEGSDTLDKKFYCTQFDESIYCNAFIPGMYVNKHLEDSLWKWTIESRLLRMDPVSGLYPYRYSDLGYYFLKRMIEKYTNQELEDFLDANLYKPMGMYSSLYKPLERFSREQIAPTERDVLFRDTLIWGTVHDQGASLMDGVGGHAGLFSTANDLAKLGQLMLQKGAYGEHRYISEETIDEFTRKQFKDNRRALAWDMIRIEGNGGTSDLASPKCYGHSGFTGTGIWIDPTYDLVYVFLSNRVHPDATNAKLYQWDIRTRIHDVIYHSIMNFNNDELVFN